MKYAILSDVHANLHALNAVLADSKAQQCTDYACLGDIVGYGAYPNECVEVIRGMEMLCVKGDYDERGSSKENLDRFVLDTGKTMEWTRSQLNKTNRKWLNNLPLVVDIKGFKLVHATLDGPQRWGYVFNRLDAEASFPYQETTVCFFGHTHVPWAYVRKPPVSGTSLVIHGNAFSKFQFNPAKKYMVNPGSVGQPRDLNPKAAYVTYDLDSQMVEMRRVDYDIAAAQRAIEDAGLPPRLSGR